MIQKLTSGSNPISAIHRPKTVHLHYILHSTHVYLLTTGLNFSITSTSGATVYQTAALHVPFISKLCAPSLQAWQQQPP